MTGVVAESPLGAWLLAEAAGRLVLICQDPNTDLAAYYLLNVVRAREAVVDSMWAAVFSANVHFAAEATDYFTQAQPPFSSALASHSGSVSSFKLKR